MADALSGFYAAYGILGALYERTQTGKGRRVEVSMFEAMTHFNLDAFTHYFSENEIMGPYSRPQVSQSYVMECADGKWVALHMSSPEKFWQGLANAIDYPELLQDERFSTREGRIDHQEAMIDVLKGIFVKRTRDEWLQRLLAEDVPHAPMYDAYEVLDDEQARHLQLEIATEHPTMGAFRTIRSPVSFDGERPLDVVAPPTLDEHRDAILNELKNR